MEVKKEARIKCGLCGLEPPPGGTWDPGAYDVLAVDVKITAATRPKNGGKTEQTIFDVCPWCFLDKVVPFLVAAGARPRTLQIDW